MNRFEKLSAALLVCTAAVLASSCSEKNNYAQLCTDYVHNSYSEMLRPAKGDLKYPFIVPGAVYSDELWDWDSWLCNIALRQALSGEEYADELANLKQYERGCVLNFIDAIDDEGWCPICHRYSPNFLTVRPEDIAKANMHKPCLAQHAAFLVREDGDAEWLREGFGRMQLFIEGYRNRYFHATTGLYYWYDDIMIGVDNDPSTYYRPDGSSASIYLNCLMYKELLAMSYLSEQLGMTQEAALYKGYAEELAAAVREHCWDEWTGMYYSVDLNLKPIDPDAIFHKGAPRDWDCLIQRLGSWVGFMAMWSGIATPEQAERMVHENLEDSRTFGAEYGVRTLSKMEKMYSLRASGNPSCWLGPVWGISNYMVWRGLADYGFTKEAKHLANQTVTLFGRDIEEHGAMHEYYNPDSGEPIINEGFQNWNLLVVNMIAWLSGDTPVREF